MRWIVGWIFAGCLLFAGAARGQSLEDIERFTDGSAEDGARLYKRYCSGCHGAGGRGGAQGFLPHVPNLTAKDYIEFIPDGFLLTVIAEGGGSRQERLHASACRPTPALPIRTIMAGPTSRTIRSGSSTRTALELPRTIRPAATWSTPASTSSRLMAG